MTRFRALRGSWRRRPLLVLLVPAAWALVFAAAVIADGVTGEGDEQPLACGEALAVAPADGSAFTASSTRVALALDDGWRSVFGDRAELVSRDVLTEVSGLFKGLHIHLLPVRVERWSTPADATSAEEMLHLLERQVDPISADIVIGFTGRRLAPEDGRSEVGGRYALVAHHPEDATRDAIVLAHEVAHLFGANHACDLPGYEGLMSEVGFGEARLLCPCTRRILEVNAARFHAALSSGDGDEAAVTPAASPADGPQ